MDSSFQILWVNIKGHNFWIICCCSVTQLCLTLCDPMDRTMPGFPVLHQLLELAQTYVYWVSDVIQPSYPVIPFSSCLQSFPVSGSFLINCLFASGGQSIGVSASVLPVNIQSWFPLGLTGWIFLQPKGLSRVFANNTFQKNSILWRSVFFMVQLSDSYMTTGKAIVLTIRTFVGKVISLLFNMLSRIVTDFLPRHKSHLTSWLQSPSAVILEAKKIKSVSASTFSLCICHEAMEPDAMISAFECWVSSQPSHSPLSPSSRDSLVPLHFLSEWYHLHIWGRWYFSRQSWF